MKSIATFLLASYASTTLAHGEPDLQHEHAGDLFRKAHQGYGGTPWCEEGVLHGDNSTGRTVAMGGESLYIAGRKDSDTAIVYLTDIFGNALVNNRLLVVRQNFFRYEKKRVKLDQCRKCDADLAA